MGVACVSHAICRYMAMWVEMAMYLHIIIYLPGDAAGVEFYYYLTVPSAQRPTPWDRRGATYILKKSCVQACSCWRLREDAGWRHGMGPCRRQGMFIEWTNYKHIIPVPLALARSVT